MRTADGQDAAARQLLDALPEVRARFDPNAIGSGAPGSAGVFALAAIPARYALERAHGPDAAKLVAQASRYLYPEAMTYYAKAIGATRIGDRATARGAIEGLRAIRDRLAQQEEPYWAGQTAIQLRSASAWLAFAEGRPMEASPRCGPPRRWRTQRRSRPSRRAAGAGARAGREMLLQMKEPRARLKEFEATLEHEPNRFRALSGAARSALLAGNREKARSYYATLLKVCERADTPGRADLVEATTRGVGKAPRPLQRWSMAKRVTDPAGNVAENERSPSASSGR
jgi:tetratricopeptide (TPR) repeat protein